MIPGRIYHVAMRDCCIGGEFTAMLLEADDNGYGGGLLRFDNGVVLTNFGQVTLTMIEPQGDSV